MLILLKLANQKADEQIILKNSILFQYYRYRIRLINAEFLNCPTEISIDNHTMYVVSSDGNDLKAEKGKSHFFNIEIGNM